jgi:hypothetical protein
VIGYLIFEAFAGESKYSKRAKQKITMGNMKAIAAAWEKYYQEEGTYCNNDNDYSTCDWGNMSIADLQKMLVPKYLVKIYFLDGWEREMQICCTNIPEKKYMIRSSGADGKWQGSDYDRNRSSESLDLDIVYSNGEYVQYPNWVK